MRISLLRYCLVLSNCLGVSCILVTTDGVNEFPLNRGDMGYGPTPKTPRHVVLLLKDDSVSQVRASLNRNMDGNETKAIVKNIQATQDALVHSIEMCGGKVIQQYQHALNGIRVQIHEENDELLKSLSGVVDILPVTTFQRMNVESVPFLDVPKVWNRTPLGLGFHGENIRVGIIDTGIDYTHANFGGPGTVDAFTLAVANSANIANSSLLGPMAPKVKGGYDFAGDSYDSTNDPTPDPNPLDSCARGHGSHVAGTVGGFGVKVDGTTFQGIYNESIYDQKFLIGPGVAPMVDLYAYRVFGCQGGTNLVVDAIDRAIQDNMDVINMSLGSDFGVDNYYSAESLAIKNAVLSGVIVVAAAGNGYQIPYITGTPASVDAAISVTAIDSHASHLFFLSIAWFSSGGPRFGDSFLKPDIAAPGVAIASTAMGTGNAGIAYSGTSMATPHIAGVAALVRQAHPTWSVVEIKQAIMSTANSSKVMDFNPSLAGNGLVDPFAAVRTNVWAAGTTSMDHFGASAVNFGYIELTSTLYTSKKGIIVSNYGKKTVTFLVTVANVNGVPHMITLDANTINVDPRTNATLGLTLQVPAVTAGNSSGFFDASGLIVLTPVGNQNNGISLSVPYYMVPRSVSAVNASIHSIIGSSSKYIVSVINNNGPIAAQSVEFFAWSIHVNETTNPTFSSVRAVGVRSEFDSPHGGDATDPLITFAINTHRRWSSSAPLGFKIYFDVDPLNNNGDDYYLHVYDVGPQFYGRFSGTLDYEVVSVRSFSPPFIEIGDTYAPTDSSILMFRLMSSRLCFPGEPCLNATNPRFTFRIESLNVTNDIYEDVSGRGSFNPFSPSMILSSSQLGSLGIGESNSILIQVNSTEWDKTPALGVLVVTPDNKAGKDQALELCFPKNDIRATKVPIKKKKDKSNRNKSGSFRATKVPSATLKSKKN